MRRAIIVGLSGTVLSPAERSFLARERPAGVILFKRNCEDLDEIRALTSAVRDAVGEATLVLIDQEGGRVRRLRPPLWRDMPAAAAFGLIWDRDPARGQTAARLAAHLTAVELRAIGIDTSCAPVLDLAIPGAHDIIGDRAYGETPAKVAALGRAVCEGLMAGGVLPVIKHIPGHGRARADSHLELPVVETAAAELAATDFAPFRALADMPAAMTAHVVYAAIDPLLPASTSAKVTAEVMRRQIGFDGLLMSDDLGMKALAGPFDARTRAVIEAGSDVALHCSGAMDEMQLVAAAAPMLAGAAAARYARALAITAAGTAPDVGDAEAALAEALLATA